MNEITHETCSELLRPYLRGELDRAVRENVEAHLAGCAGCRQELAGASMLTRGEVEPLNEVERAGMLRAIRAEVGPTAREPLTARWGRRFAPALGAAALLAIVAVGVVTLTDRGGQDDTAGLGRAEAPAESHTQADTFGAKRAGGDAANVPATDEADTGTGGAPAQTENLETGTLAAAAPPVVIEESFADATFDPAVLVPDPLPDPSVADQTAIDLALSAPDARVRATIRRCARAAIAASGRPLVPTYAAYYSTDDIVVIGFVWVDPETAIASYELRGWRAADCDGVTPILRRGEIRS